MSCNGSPDRNDPRENGGVGEPGLENTSGFDRKEVPLARRWSRSSVDALYDLSCAQIPLRVVEKIFLRNDSWRGCCVFSSLLKK